MVLLKVPCLASFVSSVFESPLPASTNYLHKQNPFSLTRHHNDNTATENTFFFCTLGYWKGELKSVICHICVILTCTYEYMSTYLNYNNISVNIFGVALPKWLNW
jgi:hypothetical protein